MAEIKIENINDDRKKELNIPDKPENTADWSIWECEPSTFDWHYDSTEIAYVYEGKVSVKTKDDEVEVKSGDLVTFPSGLDCTWEIKEKIRKVYQFK